MFGFYLSVSYIKVGMKTKLKQQTLAVTEAALTAGEQQQELIRLRAYELFVIRGYKHGHELADWLQAEREILART